MTVGVTHGISKEIAHFTCQFAHETQIDIEIKQHLYCDIRESRMHFECERLPQSCKLGPAQNFQIALLIGFFNLRDLLSVLHTWCTVSLEFAIDV